MGGRRKRLPHNGASPCLARGTGAFACQHCNPSNYFTASHGRALQPALITRDSPSGPRPGTSGRERSYAPRPSFATELASLSPCCRPGFLRTHDLRVHGRPIRHAFSGRLESADMYRRVGHNSVRQAERGLTSATAGAASPFFSRSRAIRSARRANPAKASWLGDPALASSSREEKKKPCAGQQCLRMQVARGALEADPSSYRDNASPGWPSSRMVRPRYRAARIGGIEVDGLSKARKPLSRRCHIRHSP